MITQQNTHHGSQTYWEDPKYVEVKGGKKYQWSGIKHLPEKSDEALSLKKVLLTLDKIVHSRLENYFISHRSWPTFMSFLFHGPRDTFFQSQSIPYS